MPFGRLFLNDVVRQRTNLIGPVLPLPRLGRPGGRLGIRPPRSSRLPLHLKHLLPRPHSLPTHQHHPRRLRLQQQQPPLREVRFPRCSTMLVTM